MAGYAVRRLLTAVPLLALIGFGAFMLTFMIPGDVAATIAGESATPQRIEEVRRQLGLDDSALTQFGRWAGGVLQGDLGTSMIHRIAVTQMIGERLGVTVSLVAFGLLIAVLVGVPAGLVAGLRPGRWTDRLVTVLTTLGLAVPAFWLATILIIVFAINLGMLPATGFVPITENPLRWLESMILPGLAIGAASAADVARQSRSAVAETVGRDHVRTSRAMGLRPRSVVGRHVLKNSGIPIVTVASLQVERLLGAAVVVELMFAMPGLGQLTVSAVRARDIPTIQGVVLTIAVVVILVNLLVDLSYAWFNPRLRKR
ncbi:MAG: ABC transporter permease subunit [Streptosporangiales bacterium]|nr:ABC transporter permease subunit [Streptosporangiales bacterium]